MTAAFQIYDLPAGAGVLGICQMPGKTGDYAADMDAILAWAPDVTISVVQTHELTAAHATGIGQDLQANGLAWRQVPVPDFDVPDDAARAIWCGLSMDAIAILANGGRVLAHCHGGCGRSGMVLLRLLLMTGEDPAAALARLRRARPCAVETDAQMAWATAFSFSSQP